MYTRHHEQSLTPQTPHIGFTYTADAPNWSQGYCKDAFVTEQCTTIKNLFKRAAELVARHLLTRDGFKSHPKPKEALASKRLELANSLVTEVGERNQVQGYPDFAAKMCKGVLVHPAGLGLPSPMNRKDSAQASVPPSTPVSVPPLEAASPYKEESIATSFTTTNPLFNSLADFKLGCFPVRAGVDCMPVKVLVRQLVVSPSKEEFSVEALSFKALWDLLVQRNVITTEGRECLTYQTQNELIGLLDDQDLRNAMQHH